ncbi:hypothetical protein Hanom_Chr14g01272901 [Helianthus anomalus]
MLPLFHLSLTEERERGRRWGGVGGEDVGGRWRETVMGAGCLEVGAGAGGWWRSKGSWGLSIFVYAMTLF